MRQTPGPFHSPLTDPEALAAEAPGIDFDDDGHRRLLRDVFPPLPADFDHPRPATADPQRFHLDNGQFGDADARALFALLRHRRPARMVEVGSGFVFLPDDYPPTCASSRTAAGTSSTRCRPCSRRIPVGARSSRALRADAPRR